MAIRITASSTSADGIYVDGGTRIVIEQNVVHDADLAVELASEHHKRATSYITARNNLLYDNNSNGVSIGGYKKAKGDADHCTIVNNTLFGNDTRIPVAANFRSSGNATNNVFANKSCTQRNSRCTCMISRRIRPPRRRWTTICISVPRVRRRRCFSGTR
ncbi:MAG: right-handed parallel beta-helix repeat-containing protein [Rhodospirillales bacterium]